MEILEDSSDQKFIKVGPIRLTYVTADKRPSAKDWIGRDVIRVQAYADPNGDPTSKVYPGPEYPLDADGVLPLIEAFYRLEREAR